MSTLPLGKRVAVCRYRTRAMEPAEVQEFVAGSYTSALAIALPEVVLPPVTRTLPEGSRVEV